MNDTGSRAVDQDTDAQDTRLWEYAMEEPRKELLMQVDGMTCQGCVDAVTKTIQRLDPGADVDVDLDHGRVRVVTISQSLDVAEALSKAGYDAHAMTG